MLYKLYWGVTHVRKRLGKKLWNLILSHGKLACLKKVKKTDVCSNQVISHSTDFFFHRGNCFVDELWWSHNDSINFLFLVIFFYIGLKLISLITPLFQWEFYIHFLIKNRSLAIHGSINFTGVWIFKVLLSISRMFLMMKS